MSSEENENCLFQLRRARAKVSAVQLRAAVYCRGNQGGQGDRNSSLPARLEYQWVYSVHTHTHTQNLTFFMTLRSVLRMDILSVHRILRSQLDIVARRRR